MYISEVCIKLLALSVKLYPRSSSQLRKGWWSLVQINVGKIIVTHRSFYSLLLLMLLFTIVCFPCSVLLSLTS